MVFDLLRERPEVIQRHVNIPQAPSIRTWMKAETKLGNPALKQAVEKTGDPELRRALVWSEAVNASIADMVYGVPPFPYVRECLENAQPVADMIVVSATPGEALAREWEEHDIAKYAAVIAGQEMGSKAEHLALAAGGKYPPNHVLMIGDAPGDFQAARKNSALFFPVNPGHEEASWQLLYEEALDRFIQGTYAGEYEAKLVAEFDKLLPERPPWKG
jgi:phosphoglycolate phosphatase-like HAD superfamily hydrolase